MTTTPLPLLPKEVGWLYTCVAPGLHGAKFIEDRAEQPKGGWVKYREDAVVTVTQMQAYAQQARADLEAENKRLIDCLERLKPFVGGLGKAILREALEKQP